jgi:hypothetical protein
MKIRQAWLATTVIALGMATVMGILSGCESRSPVQQKNAGPGTSTVASPTPVPRSTGRHLSGIWEVTVKDPHLSNQMCALDMFVGLVYWRFYLGGTSLEVEKFSHTADPYITFYDPNDMPFEPLPIYDVQVESDLIAFKVRDYREAFDAFRLTRFKRDRIEGTYSAYRPYGVPLGYGTECKGTLILYRKKE